MANEQLIETILACQPEPLPGQGVVRWHPLVEPFGYYFYGVGERWYWFDNRVPSQHPSAAKGHRFLQDASLDELTALLAALAG